MYLRKNTFEEVPEEDTDIWSCTKVDCKGWMRDNFVFESLPSCPLCSSEMIKSKRMLPPIIR